MTAKVDVGEGKGNKENWVLDRVKVTKLGTSPKLNGEGLATEGVDKGKGDKGNWVLDQARVTMRKKPKS